MKYILALIAAFAVVGFAMPEKASAFDACHGARRIVSYHPCGAPIYAVYHVTCTPWGQRGQWITQNRSCGCSRCNARFSPQFRSGFGGRVHPGYGSSCSPFRPSFGRTGIFFGIRR